MMINFNSLQEDLDRFFEKATVRRIFVIKISDVGAADFLEYINNFPAA